MHVDRDCFQRGGTFARDCVMPVLEGYENADTPHAKTVMAPGWTYGCHSSKTGDKPRGGPATYPVIDGYVIGDEYEAAAGGDLLQPLHGHLNAGDK